MRPSVLPGVRSGAVAGPVLTGLVALALPLVSCGARAGDEAELGVEMRLDPSPPRVGDVRVELTLTDGSGAPLTDATVRVEGNMNHAGMVPEIADAEAVGDGEYVAELELTMGGDWFFVVTAVTDDGRRLEHVVDVPGVAAP